MNRRNIPPRAFLKRQARQAMVQSLRPCMQASAAMLALQLAALYIQMTSGGILNYYLLNAADYTTATGIWLAEGGFTAILRFDMAGVIFALPLSFQQILTFVIIHSIIFIITVPLSMGVLEQYHAILHSKARPFSAIFRWYFDLRLTGKAIGLGLVLSLVKWIARIVGFLPGLILIVWGTGNAQLGETAFTALMFLSYLLILAGEAAAYWAYTLILPAQYLLARDSDASIAHVLSAGRNVFRDRRGNYFKFRLSFLLWYLSVNLSYGTTGLFVLPYSELSNFLYLAAAEAPPQPEDAPLKLQ